MTRGKDDKRGNSEFSSDDKDTATYNAKVEARFTKEAKAKRQQGTGEVVPPRMNNSHADDGGEHRF